MFLGAHALFSDFPCRSILGIKTLKTEGVSWIIHFSLYPFHLIPTTGIPQNIRERAA